ncbi:MAG: thioredoxin family protein [Pseudomonadota bacterium]
MKRIIAALALLALPAFGSELGDDGLHKASWMQETFKDLDEDLEEARAQGKRLLIMVEQRGCIYCTRLHEEVFSDPAITAYLNDDLFVVQLNMFGDIEVTDLDGETLPEKAMVRKWGLLFTPTLMFFPERLTELKPAHHAAVAVMPGAFGKGTTLDLITWVLERGYEGDEDFQKYHARKHAERMNGG